MAAAGGQPRRTTNGETTPGNRPSSIHTIAILGHTVSDLVASPTGADATTPMLGGAGAYAAIGARIVAHEHVVLSSGVGEDFAGLYGRFLHRWRIDASGLAVRDERTPQTLITYNDDGSRTETSLLGDEHFQRCAPRLSDLPSDLTSQDGLYVFNDASPDAWSSIINLRREVGCTVLWELSAVEKGVAGWKRVTRLLPEIDVISLNIAEATGLTRTTVAEKVIEQLLGAGARTVCLRAGERGSFVASKTAAFAVATPDSSVVDPTGAGNAYSGAFLAATVAGLPIEVAACLASAAASYIIEQHGPPRHRPSRLSVERRVASVQATTLSLPKEVPNS